MSTILRDTSIKNKKFANYYLLNTVYSAWEKSFPLGYKCFRINSSEDELPKNHRLAEQNTWTSCLKTERTSAVVWQYIALLTLVVHEDNYVNLHEWFKENIQFNITEYR